jgi:hypothetical protein
LSLKAICGNQCGLEELVFIILKMLPDSILTYVQDFLNAFEDMVEYLKGGDQIIAQMEEELRYTHILKLKIGH